MTRMIIAARASNALGGSHRKPTTRQLPAQGEPSTGAWRRIGAALRPRRTQRPPAVPAPMPAAVPGERA